MRGFFSVLVLCFSGLSLWGGSAQAQSAESAPPPAAASPWIFYGAFELSLLGFPSGPPGGSMDGFLQGTPVLGLDGGDAFGVELGAPLRLRLLDQAPRQAPPDFGGVLRRQDWDELSDFGQLVRILRAGPEGGPVSLQAGALGLYSMGHGHLLGRYSNQLSPNYHPAGAQLTAYVGPTRTQLFVSDVLAARIFAGGMRVDVGQLLEAPADQVDRYHAELSVAHDFGRGGGVTPALTLIQLDTDATLYRGSQAQIFVLAGLGSRANEAETDFGGLFGVGVEGMANGWNLGGKAELRHQGDGFRHGLFGPAYELSRFSATGLAEPPIAREMLPEGFSGYGELHWGVGGEGVGAGRVRFSAALEYFAFGRCDADGALTLEFPGGKGSTALRFIATGMGQQSRYAVGGEGRYRFIPALYGLVTAGNLFFPQADGTLSQGMFLSAGVGVDFER